VTEDQTESPTFAPSESPSNAPSNAPSNSPSNAPSDAPSNAPSLSSSPSGSVLDFLAWNPSLPLQHCEGDCDRDTDCDGDMICYQRARASGVPGCEKGRGVPAIADFCIFLSDDPN
jgi:hypothetical protein